jgi:hypothetical protein
MTPASDHRQTIRRWGVLTLLATVLLCLGGCMLFVRLLMVREQLKDFDANFTAERSPGPRPNLAIIARHPVLTEGDLAWMVSAEATSHDVAPGSTTIAHWRFRKESIVGDPANLPGRELDLAVTLDADGRAARVDLPPPVVRAMTPDLIIAMLRAMGGAAIDQQNRTASAVLTVAKRPHRPSRADMEAEFGIPHRVLVDTTYDTLIYRYQAVDAAQAALPPPPFVQKTDPRRDGPRRPAPAVTPPPTVDMATVELRIGKPSGLLRRCAVFVNGSWVSIALD